MNYPNFETKNLQGKNFKNQNLTGVSFQGFDIRGANFTNAILKNADFKNVRAGLPSYAAFGWVIVSCMGSSLLAILVELAGQRAGDRLVYKPTFGTSPDDYGLNIWVSLIVFSIIVTFISTIRQGLEPAFKITLGVATVSITLNLSYVLINSLARLRVGDSIDTIASYAIRSLAAVATGSITAFGMGIIAVTIAIGITVAVIAHGNQTRFIVMFSTVFAGVSLGAMARTSAAGIISILCGELVVFASIFSGFYIAHKALSGDDKYLLVTNVAIFFASIGGTSFRGADLTDATFQDANLKSTDFRKSTVTRTCWSNAKYLDRSRLGGTILVEPSVRHLLVTLLGSNGNYVGLNFKGANLVGALLNDANLTEADISDANFEGACLKDANLTKAQALGTNFDRAVLTGACLEAWNTDSNTQLQEAICDYIYLLKDRGERRPSSGNFAAGEFGKLYQEFLDTVVLIFRNGIDWKAFVTAFQKVQVANEDTELEIQSIENKGDGVVLVRVSVPPDADKAKIHSEFTQNYDLALKLVEEKYQGILAGKEEKIEGYRQQVEIYRYLLESERQQQKEQNANMQEIIRILSSKPANIPINVPEVAAIYEDKFRNTNLVILTLESGDFASGFSFVIAQIWQDGERLPIQIPGQLPPRRELLKLYHRWQSLYQNFIEPLAIRLEVKQAQITTISVVEVNQLAEDLEGELNKWLKSEQFITIDRKMYESFHRSDEVQVIIQSQNSDVRKLPWHLWDFFKSYRKAEIALSSPFYDRVEKIKPPRDEIGILSILGDRQEIDIDRDRQILSTLDARVEFLDRPNRQQLDERLWDEKGWDIICFSGHSSSKIDSSTGRININQTDELTITELKNALTTAIERGLQIAIFNSCDGLGIARQLAQLHIPLIVVFREIVPDTVAQEFLKNFLTAFASGKSFYLAVREAREKLQSLEQHFPCATWLPVIVQNPAEVPPTWQDLLHKTWTQGE
ncbi:MAG: pentapeptide repeat-containing protein [Oscillatoriaceae cyanobacterium Prado104]|jgi:uncharacterized protein YjbI with pentapeptide repeats|nr:pentapeptide repeat-containing protein [Oscillatoriaceae cyanobacterium Prado104]